MMSQPALADWRTPSRPRAWLITFLPRRWAFGDHRVELVLAEAAAELAGARVDVDPVGGELDHVDPVLDLDADLLDRLLGVAHQQPDRGVGAADPARVVVRQALARGDLAAGAGDARPDIEAGIDRVAHRQRDAAGDRGVGHRRHPGLEHLLRRHHRPDGAELDRRVEVDILLVHGVAVADVHMDIDQPGHDERVAEIDRRIARARRRRLGAGADKGDALALGDDGVVRNRLGAGAGEQRSATEVPGHVPVPELERPLAGRRRRAPAR